MWSRKITKTYDYDIIWVFFWKNGKIDMTYITISIINTFELIINNMKNTINKIVCKNNEIKKQILITCNSPNE